MSEAVPEQNSLSLLDKTKLALENSILIRKKSSEIRNTSKSVSAETSELLHKMEEKMQALQDLEFQTDKKH